MRRPAETSADRVVWCESHPMSDADFATGVNAYAVRFRVWLSGVMGAQVIIRVVTLGWLH